MNCRCTHGGGRLEISRLEINTFFQLAMKVSRENQLNLVPICYTKNRWEFI